MMVKRFTIFTLIMVSLMFIIVSSAQEYQIEETPEPRVISRTASSTTYKTSDGFKTVYGEANYLKDGVYVAYDLNIQNSTYSNYIYQTNVDGIPFKVYIRNNSNTDSAVRFEKDGYYFSYDLSGGALQWAEQVGFPARTDTLGGGVPSNSQDSAVKINGNEFVYPGAFSNTNVTYNIYRDMLKETFVLSSLPSLKDYLYLEYTGKVKFNKTLSICANDVCYTPSGTEDDFTTTGQIDFRDAENNTIFFLKPPIITDAVGNTTIGTYKVKGSDAQMSFALRINKTFLDSAVFPIYIDPTVTYDFNPEKNFEVIYFSSVIAGSNYCGITPPEGGPYPSCGSSLHNNFTNNNGFDAEDGDLVPISILNTQRTLFLVYSIIPIEPNEIFFLNWSFKDKADYARVIRVPMIWNNNNRAWEECQGANQTHTTLTSWNCTRSSTIHNVTAYLNDTLNGISDGYTRNYLTISVIQTSGFSDSYDIDYAQFEVSYNGILINSPTSSETFFNTGNISLNITTAGYNETLWYNVDGLDNDGYPNNITLCTDCEYFNSTILINDMGTRTINVYGNKTDGTETVESVTINLYNQTQLNSVNDTDGEFTKDTYFRTDGVSQSLVYGDSITCRVGTGTQPARTLYWQNYSANFSYVVIKNATLFFTFTTGSSANSFDMYKLLHPWEEGKGNGITNALGFNGTTYNERWFEANNNDGNTPFNKSDADWQTVGLGNNTDMNPNEVISNGVLATGNTYGNNITAYVQDYVELNNVNDTYGFALFSSLNGADYFISSEAATNQPYTIVEYINDTINVTLNSPINYYNNTNTSQIFNFTAIDPDLDSCSLYGNWTDSWAVTQTIRAKSGVQYNFTNINLPDGSYLWNVRCNQTQGQSSEAPINFTLFVRTSGPILNIVEPTNNRYNNYSVSLLYTRYANTNPIDQCWWNYDNNYTNVSLGIIGDCTNTTVNLTSGEHQIRLYANDSLNIESYATINYTIDLSSPSIVLNNPANWTWYKDLTNITFNFTAQHTDGIEACSLWINESGTFKANYTNTTTIGNNVIYNMSLILKDQRQYSWNVNCSTGLGSYAFALNNYTFGIDSIFPNVNIDWSPTTGSTSTINCIDTLQFNFSIEDNFTSRCRYAVNHSSLGIDTQNTTVACNLERINFTLTRCTTGTDYFTILAYANDSAGHEVMDSATFSRSYSESGGVISGGGGGGGEPIEVPVLYALTTPGEPCEFDSNCTSGFCRDGLCAPDRCGNKVCDEGEYPSCQSDCGLLEAIRSGQLMQSWFMRILVLGILPLSFLLLLLDPKKTYRRVKGWMDGD